jgi:imidazole glycerol-phosphate synthase subunit HisH
VIALVDYGAGNLTSVCKAFRVLGAEPRTVREAGGLGGARAIVVPGVGHFGATAALDARWRQSIRERVAAGVPLLGICLGMQWLFEGSDEAPGCEGLGLFRGRSRRLSGAAVGEERLKVPHVGWNQLRIGRPDPLVEGVADGAHVYFTHSYAVPDAGEAIAWTAHGERFAAVVGGAGVWGAQFHPEKSGSVGLRILRNFLAAAGVSGPAD